MIGGEELAQGRFALKNMETGAQGISRVEGHSATMK